MAEEAVADQVLEPTVNDVASTDDSPTETSSTQAAAESDDAVVRMVIRFRPRLQLADLKAQLIVNRLAGLGDLKSTQPALDSLPEDEQLEEFEVRLETHEDFDHLRSAAEVDGVESIDFPDIDFLRQCGRVRQGGGSR